MIKLVDILKEMYVDKLGNLIGEADFVILEGGLRGGIFKNSDKINVGDYINFTTKIKSFRKTNIANKIYKQILEIYNKSALKKYNDSINFEPSLNKSNGGEWEAAGFGVNITKGLRISGVLEASHYYPSTGYENMIKGMRDALGVKDTRSDDEKNIENDKSTSKKFGDLDIDDFKDKILSLPMVCIPKFNFKGNLVELVDTDLDTGNQNFEDNHNLYTKSNLLHDLNEVGMYLLSKKEKPQVVNLDELGYKLYTVDYISKYTGYREDGTSYNMILGKPRVFGDDYTSKDTVTNYVMANKGENVKQAIKRLSGKGEFNMYDTLFNNTFPDNRKQKNEVEQIKQDIKEIPHAKLDINFFNYLKKHIYGDNNVSKNEKYGNVTYYYEKESVFNKNGVFVVNKFLDND